MAPGFHLRKYEALKLGVCFSDQIVASAFLRVEAWAHRHSFSSASTAQIYRRNGLSFATYERRRILSLSTHGVNEVGLAVSIQDRCFGDLKGELCHADSRLRLDISKPFIRTPLAIT